MDVDTGDTSKCSLLRKLEKFDLYKGVPGWDHSQSFSWFMFHEFLMDILFINQTKYQHLCNTQKAPSHVLGVLEATRIIHHGSELKHEKWQKHFAYIYWSDLVYII